MKDLENKKSLNESEEETVSGGYNIHIDPLPDNEPSEGGATGSW